MFIGPYALIFVSFIFGLLLGIGISTIVALYLDGRLL